MHYIVFICGLLNDAVGNSDFIASEERVVNELEKIWKEAVVV
jgi:hypothetical protein